MNEIILIENKIFTIRNQQVMIDRDLAELYQVPTKRLNEAVKRNIERFPNHFRFQLTDNEVNELVAICDRFEVLKHSSSNPYAFTEQGVSMLSAVLRSDIAVQISIKIMDTFVQMRRTMGNYQQLLQLSNDFTAYKIETNDKFEKVFKALEEKHMKPNQGIFFDGQIFDAYVFVCDLIKSAKKEIILIDNYIDESVLQLLTKRSKKVSVTIFTPKITKVLQQDIAKYNAQHEKIKISTFAKSHDRFLIIDEQVYHFGASLKDLGKKWFAFSKMQISKQEITEKLKTVEQ
ncbi:MAG: ORF6N domain-containing protein [Flavobacteriaceae bacterium]|nr:ORF6N domain-containing protein [Flavobacteriaceae bacterium]